MDSNNAPRYLLNHAALSSVYYQGKEDNGSSNIIDLGLSLRVINPQTYHPAPHHGSYEELIDWQDLHPQIRNGRSEEDPRAYIEHCDDEAEGIQSKLKERWDYVKVNMDGVIVGRKICILDHMSYSSLALQLEDMFGKQSISGLRLFQDGSEFSLFYKDRDDIWRMVGDVPWKEFVNRVKRLRIVQKEESTTPHPSS
ncbi:PREDICTED: auxin-responsive protein IAA32 [Ipomoea nil]|uniref:auxin-responsive protein IAA32 n=1 Tax=Ipomoea nil TaxID=35883 RepID=UPI000901AAD9|nr:PREDICTED: auxin-responsive protein IAA32 [Ipomoea nil]